MNADKLSKLQNQVRIGGKVSMDNTLAVITKILLMLFTFILTDIFIC